MNLRNLFVNVALWKQLLRYGIVGGSVTIVYVALTSLIIETTAWSALKASITGFVLTIPFAYVAHRFVTFASKEAYLQQLVRFVITMTVAFIISSVSMLAIVHIYEAHYGYALLVTTVLVPSLNYLVLSAWVFKDGRARPLTDVDSEREELGT